MTQLPNLPPIDWSFVGVFAAGLLVGAFVPTSAVAVAFGVALGAAGGYTLYRINAPKAE